ncbi:hypothetical protein D3C71_2225170 [compost metagenome]
MFCLGGHIDGKPHRQADFRGLVAVVALRAAEAAMLGNEFQGGHGLSPVKWVEKTSTS